MLYVRSCLLRIIFQSIILYYARRNRLRVGQIFAGRVSKSTAVHTAATTICCSRVRFAKIVRDFLCSASGERNAIYANPYALTSARNPTRHIRPVVVLYIVAGSLSPDYNVVRLIEYNTLVSQAVSVYRLDCTDLTNWQRLSDRAVDLAQVVLGRKPRDEHTLKPMDVGDREKTVSPVYGEYHCDDCSRLFSSECEPPLLVVGVGRLKE